ncbi:uncharacterized protein LOC127150090 [Cucumis melo]|uniref:Uncharacterized protein LOC127150090 n=1 Tax=Cucumis melo TaxID=3656 RepID=A0ABM3KYM3_CUCME|nr:uncharacterized protein LOC127150090 [Cucumis melo]
MNPHFLTPNLYLHLSHPSLLVPKGFLVFVEADPLTALAPNMISFSDLGFYLQTRFVEGDPLIFSLLLNVPLLRLSVSLVVSSFPSLIRQTLHTVVCNWLPMELGREDVAIHEYTLLRGTIVMAVYRYSFV